MKYYFISGIQAGKYMAGIFEGNNNGQILADMTKNGIMINCLIELTKEEREEFVSRMQAKIATPTKKGISIVK